MGSGVNRIKTVSVVVALLWFAGSTPDVRAQGPADQAHCVIETIIGAIESNPVASGFFVVRASLQHKKIAGPFSAR